MTEGQIPPPSNNAGNVPPPPPPPGAGPVTTPYATPTTPSTGYPNEYVGPTPTPDDKTMAMLAHLLGILLGFIGPLIIWLIKKDQSPFVDDQGKESLNFQFMLIIGYVIGSVTSMICIGFLIIPAVWIFGIIFSIMAALKAKDGIAYRYPVNLRLIK
jgi:uncharacterized Tic20 family protein